MDEQSKVGINKAGLRQVQPVDQRSLVVGEENLAGHSTKDNDGQEQNGVARVNPQSVVPVIHYSDVLVDVIDDPRGLLGCAMSLSSSLCFSYVLVPISGIV